MASDKIQAAVRGFYTLQMQQGGFRMKLEAIPAAREFVSQEQQSPCKDDTEVTL